MQINTTSPQKRVKFDEEAIVEEGGQTNLSQYAVTAPEVRRSGGLQVGINEERLDRKKVGGDLYRDKSIDLHYSNDCLNNKCTQISPPNSNYTNKIINPHGQIPPFPTKVISKSNPRHPLHNKAITDLPKAPVSYTSSVFSPRPNFQPPPQPFNPCANSDILASLKRICSAKYIASSSADSMRKLEPEINGHRTPGIISVASGGGPEWRLILPLPSKNNASGKYF